MGAKTTTKGQMEKTRVNKPSTEFWVRATERVGGEGRRGDGRAEDLPARLGLRLYKTPEIQKNRLGVQMGKLFINIYQCGSFEPTVRILPRIVHTGLFSVIKAQVLLT